MTRDFLKEFGLDKEQIDKICAEHSKDIGDKLNRITELETELNGVKEKLTTANSSLDTLKKNNKDNEALQTEISNYKNQIKELNEKYTQSQIKNFALRQFEKAGAIDAELMLHTIDLTKASIDSNGNIIGVTDQVNAIVNDSVRSAFFNKPVVSNTENNTNENDNINNVNTNNINNSIPDTPDRGGYDPMQGNTPSETDFGTIFGTQFSKQGESTVSSDAFWNSL